MTMSSKIFEALASVIKMNDTIVQLSEDVKSLAKEVRDMDRRLIRLETFLEIAEKQRHLTHKKSND